MLLPINIFEELFLHLDITTLIHVCQTCKSLSYLYARDYLWSRKYQHEFKKDINNDIIACMLKLSPQQAYIRRYTQEGGVTYGSQNFISLDKLFPKAILSKNNLLIAYYHKIYNQVLKRWFSDEHYISFYHVVDWYELIRASIITQRHDLASLFHQDLIKTYETCNSLAKKYQSNRTFNIDILLNNPKKGDYLYRSYYDDIINEKRNKYNPIILEGYILAKRYRQAKKIVDESVDLSSRDRLVYAKYIVQTGDKYFIDLVMKCYPVTFSHYTMLSVTKGAELITIKEFLLIETQELPVTITPEFYINLLKRSSKSRDELREDCSFHPPFQEEVISYLEGIGLTKKEIWSRSREHILASPQLIKRYSSFIDEQIITKVINNLRQCEMKHVYNWSEHLLFTLKRHDKQLLLNLYRGGYKDLWLIGLRWSEEIFTDKTNYSPCYTMPLDMYSLLR